MPPPKPPPPLLPVAFSLSIYRLRLVVPAVAVVLLALGVVPGVLYVFTHPPTPLPTPQVPLEQAALPQGWTASSVEPAMLALVLPGKLPKPVPQQRRPPCADRIEEEINGYCWIALRAQPPCPAQSWEHDGSCYGMALPAKPIPTSGEPNHRAVADP